MSIPEKKIITKNYSYEEICAISEEAARQSREGLVSVKEIEAHNLQQAETKLNIIKKINRFLFRDHPVVGALFFSLLLTIVAAIIMQVFFNSFSYDEHGRVTFELVTSSGILFFLFIVIVSVFSLINILTRMKHCKICGALFRCKEVLALTIGEPEVYYTHETRDDEVHTYRVWKGTKYCVYECKKCKKRSYEIVRYRYKELA